MKRFVLIFYILFIFLQSCARIDLAATWADNYIFGKIDQYFDVSSMQAQFVKKAVREDVEKVREQLFPELKQELEHLEIIFSSDIRLTAEIVSAEQEKLKNIFYSSLKIFEPSAQEFAKKLEGRQLATFKAIFNKKSEELQKYLLNPEEAKKDRYNKIKREFETWTGFLTEAQQLAVKKFSDENIFPIREELLNREKISKEFLESYKRPEKRKKFITELFTRYEPMRDPAYTLALQSFQDKLVVLVTSILNQLTPAQKKYMMDILNERIDQLKSREVKSEK